MDENDFREGKYCKFYWLSIIGHMKIKKASIHFIINKESHWLEVDASKLLGE